MICFKNKSIYFLVFFIFLLSNKVFSSVVINEIMASNSKASGIIDEDGDSSDWIELYNNSNVELNMFGYTLSDPNNTWTLPEISIHPKKFLIVYASGKNKSYSELHTNFKINKNGEDIVLRDAEGIVVDSFSARFIPQDNSCGRYPDGNDSWFFYSVLTVSPMDINFEPEFSGFVDKPIFSSENYFPTNDFDLEIRVNPIDAEIYYTLDGSEPTKNSEKYVGALYIQAETNRAVVVRARAYKDNWKTSLISTQSYFFLNKKLMMSIVSMSTNKENLFGETGIWDNYYESWERPVHLEFYEPNGKKGFAVNAGAKLQGEVSKIDPQKAFKFYLRGSVYGDIKINYEIFPNLKDINGQVIDEFNNIILRAAGQDQFPVYPKNTHFRDVLMHSLARELELDVMASRPAILFVNGSYYGIYYLREKKNEHYFESHYKFNPEQVEFSNSDEFNDMEINNFVEENPMDEVANYNFIKNKIDINNHINYLIAQIYAANFDLDLHHNSLKWRAKDSPWRYFFYDLDFAFRNFVPGFNLKGLTSTYIWLAGLFDNKDYRADFIQRMSIYLNTVLSDNNVLDRVDFFKKQISQEIGNHLTAWMFSDLKPKLTKKDWEANIEELKCLIKKRSEKIFKVLQEEFFLDQKVSVQFETRVAGSSSPGRITINEVDLPDYDLSGTYFPEIPMRLRAVANFGYQFIAWEQDNEIISNSEYFELKLETGKDTEIQAVFKIMEDKGDTADIIITEINYNSADNFDTADWIEIFNNEDRTVDLSGWILRDKGDDLDSTFFFPTGTKIPSQEYLLLVRCLDRFTSFFPDLNLVREMNFKLRSEGDQIRLFNPFGILVDFVEYDNREPWPLEADGTGKTLVLKHLTLDNKFSKNWTISPKIGGNPGAGNETISPAGYFLEIFHESPQNRFMTLFINKAEIGTNYSIIISDEHEDTENIYLEGQVDNDLVVLDNISLEYFRNGFITVEAKLTDVFFNKGESLLETVYLDLPSPTVSFSYKRYSFVQKLFQFTSKSESAISHYYWSFGDGNISISPDPLHRFKEDGIYTVSLEVELYNKLKASFCSEVYIDTTRPKYYSVFFNQDIINFTNQKKVSLRVEEAEIGTEYDYCITDNNDQTENIIGRGLVEKADFVIEDIPALSLMPGKIELFFRLIDLSGNEGIYLIDVIEKIDDRLSHEVILNKGWNLFSIPYEVVDTTLSDIFSESISVGYEYYNGSYREIKKISPLKGCWIYLDELETQKSVIKGMVLPKDLKKISLFPGWNLLPIFEKEILANYFLEKEFISLLYTYENGAYRLLRESDSLQPGKSYWAKSSEKIILEI